MDIGKDLQQAWNDGYEKGKKDAAIARQSVKSEEVQRAIDWLKTGDFEIPVGDEEYTENSSHHPNTARFRQTAIAALQAYRISSAIKWTGDNLREVISMTGWNESASSKWTWEEYEQIVKEKGLKIFTPDGSAMAGIGDWIVRNGNDCHVLQAYQPWIPVSERLPEKMVEVLTYREKGYCKVLRFENDCKWYDSYNEWENNVTHWKPLPEPPKGK